MTSLLIKDLSLARPLDRAAASAVRGGIYIDICGGDGGSPRGGTPWPWPMYGMPFLPAMPMDPFPPCGYNPNASCPAPADRVIAA